ncbi:uncharacterized protein LOC117115563 isoform X2 [Anneissia japonica]|uniref:uncharacterized protein LOC117115563 isoform X2 n=1 Tax=Anneissia japonica TaxID=1529436 RepID=UPI0014258415|nr:uncharacterized protein LOC117115563 isoform X2 [Anneissia japonica]
MEAGSNSEKISNMTTERPGWSENSLQLYNTLLETTKDGKWVKVLTTRNPPPTQPDFGRLTMLDPAAYEYGIFVNSEEQCLKGVCEFGPYAQSAEGMVHGGAIATIIDGATQVLKATLFPDILAVTGNLKVNYKKPLPVGATVFVECHLQKRDGKKFFLSCDLKSADKSILYDTGTALFFDVNDRVNQLPEKCKADCLPTADPVTGWTEESETLFKQVQDETDASSWKIVASTKKQFPRKMFTRLPIGPGSAFEYAWLCNKETIEMRGICQFGPYTQGPDGLVHGGATATMLDSVTGVLMEHGANKKAVTAHLDIKYKLPVPIGSTVRVEAKLERTDGCKNYLQCSILTPDKSKVLVTGTALYVDLDLLYKL